MEDETRIVVRSSDEDINIVSEEVESDGSCCMNNAMVYKIPLSNHIVFLRSTHNPNQVEFSFYYATHPYDKRDCSEIIKTYGDFAPRAIPVKESNPFRQQLRVVIDE